MNPIDWLCAKAPGFEALSQEERDAIMHFALLWSLFEAAVLNTHACSISIVETAKRWEGEGQLKAELFGDCLTYFRNRHFQNNEFTEHFAGLRANGRFPNVADGTGGFFAARSASHVLRRKCALADARPRRSLGKDQQRSVATAVRAAGEHWKIQRRCDPPGLQARRHLHGSAVATRGESDLVRHR